MSTVTDAPWSTRSRRKVRWVDLGAIANHLGCFVLGGMTAFAFVAMFACMKAGSDADDEYQLDS